ncbi:PRA1 family protein F2-like [Impatiens glandulifera]|uniref:PRA1 family protein F2-like n=1 Tax=Impatiens glandulifera TaxID=253017 RepID=UPI001FB124FC|nr:PRA1 family protein F2-like [Impatiens glandulifera]
MAEIQGMENSGTLPTTSSPAPAVSNQRWKELGQRRAWKEIFDYSSINFPRNPNDAIQRIKTNISYFRKNYIDIMFLIIVLSLISNPISLAVLSVLITGWDILYFSRDEPLVVLNRRIEDWCVLLFLGSLTILMLFLSDATENVLISLPIGLVLVLIHGSVRNTDNLCVDQEKDAGSAPLMTRMMPPDSAV